MDAPEKLPTPGLKWRDRKNGPKVPYWFPPPSAVKDGYPRTSFLLQAYADDPVALSAKCCILQAMLQRWVDDQGRERGDYDGTIRSVLRLYQTHKRSPYHKLKPGTLGPYNSYLRKIDAQIGMKRVSSSNGFDVEDWHDEWSDNGRMLAAGATCAAVLKAALAFAVFAGHEECNKLLYAARAARIRKPSPRVAFATAENVVALREAAHRIGRPSAALCFAIQFETALRLWDVMGQWLPISREEPSTIVDGDRKWIGLAWEHIDADGILKFTPSKTSFTTRKEVVFDLARCPMVLEEMERVPAELRVGPVIKKEFDGTPWTRMTINSLWPRVRAEAGLPDTLWARDLRASAVTEARRAGASTDDAAKASGHAKPRITADVYDRAGLEAHQRLAEKRKIFRDRPSSGPGDREDRGCS